MRHEEHRRLHFPPELHEQVLHVEPGRRVEGAERLVHEDHPRPEDERAGDRHPLPHPTGEFVRILGPVPPGIQADLRDPLEPL